ncbi:MAG: hypothetical protein MUF25_01525 [Pirellulaceae bacterium]|nr:hypothetical protein [Pirellulaceae bacterium]
MTFDPTQVALIAGCEVPGILFALAYDPQRGRLYGAGTDWSVYCVDPSAEKPVAEKKWTHHENYISALSLVGDQLISASYDGRIVWTAVETGERVRSVDAHDGWVRDLAVFPGGRRLVSVGDDMLVKLWNAETGDQDGTLEGHASQTPQGYKTALYTVAITPDGTHIASGDRTGTVCIWKADTGKLVRRLEAPTFYTYDPQARVRSIGGIRSLCFSTDGNTLAIAGIGKVTNVDGFVGPCRVELWDWQSGKAIRTWQDQHQAVLNHVVFHPREPWLVAGGGGDSGGILIFWDPHKDQPIHKAKPKGHLQRLVLAPDIQRTFACGHEGFQFWGPPHEATEGVGNN